MTLGEATVYLKKGYHIRRNSWLPDRFITPELARTMENLNLTGADITFADWEVKANSFIDAINALMEGKIIFHTGDDVDKHICHRMGKTMIGLGTCGAREYKFTHSDQMASDWIIRDI